MDALIKNLDIELREDPDKEMPDSLSGFLLSSEGIETVEIQDNRLIISYDVLHITCSGVMRLLRDRSCIHEPGMLAGIKIALRNLQDNNDIAQRLGSFL